MKSYSTLKIAASVAALAAFTIASYSAPTEKNTEGTNLDPEYRRIAVMPRRAMPFPVVRFETNADGSYSEAGMTYHAEHGFKYAFEKIGANKYRIAVGPGVGQGSYIWEVDEADTLLEKAKTDPKIVEAIKTFLVKRPDYTLETYLQRFGEKEQYRVSIGRSRYALPPTMPVNEVLKLIAARDPRTQSLVDEAMADTPCSTSDWGGWENRPGIAKKPTNVERVGMDQIASELLTTKVAPDAEISLRNEVERLNVKHRRQIGDTCETYSAYHILDYYMKRGDIQHFSFEEYVEMTARLQNGRRSSTSGNALLTILAQKNPGLKIRVREMFFSLGNQNTYSEKGCLQITTRFLQHELEAGRPIWAGMGNHQVMLVGVKPTSIPNLRTLDLTALDSTGYGDKDKGYSHWSRLELTRVFTLEFVKQPPQ